MNAASANPDWSADVSRRIEQSIESAFAACPPTEVVRAARYATLGGGHRWRGRMAVAAGAIFRADAIEIVLPLAAALEMLQAASLVLDDLPSMDNAMTRRGRACVHFVFPDWAVDLLPAFLVNLAYHVVAGHAAASEGCRIRALLLLGETGTRLAQGQELDLALARKSASGSELLDCYALKSGSLFAAALAGGALLCGAEAADVAALREAGLKLGQAYQILDDVADGPEEDSAYKDAGRITAYSLFGPVAARARAEELLEEAARMLDRFGPAAGSLRELLDRILT